MQHCTCRCVLSEDNGSLCPLRLTIAEEGCARILNHRSSSRTLVHLCRALGADETGTLTNTIQIFLFHVSCLATVGIEWKF